MAQEIIVEDSAEILSDSIYVEEMPLDSLPFKQRAVLRLDKLMKSSLLETTQLGLMIYDLDADSVLYAHNERQLLRPASTMKILTAIAAIDRLGNKYRFKTSVSYTGERNSNNLHGNIYLKGGMNPALEDYDVECMIESITQLGIDTIHGSLIADRSFKDSDLLGEGWCWDDDNPVLSPMVFRSKDSLFEVLKSRLIARGIIIMGNDSTAATPSNAKTIIERSSPIEPILTKMMKDSDNLYAEAVLYHIGASVSKPSTAKKSLNVVKEIMRKAGLNPNNYRLADGSGLSLYNYLSAEAETMLLRYAYKQKRIFGTLCQSLPSAGVDGTLRKRMLKEPLYDNVRAKTGTLTGIYSLAGYCTSPENHTLAFCIINQGVMKGQSARKFQDQVCEAICK